MSANFLWYAGSNATSGLVTTAFTAVTSEFFALATGSATVSAVNGTSGVFSNANGSQAIFADAFFYVGSPGISSALSTGANVAGWFLTSPDSGSTFEGGFTMPPSRSPDFIIAMPPVAINSSTTWIFKASGSGPLNCVVLPALTYKVCVQNNTGQTFPTATTVTSFLKFAPFAEQY